MKKLIWNIGCFSSRWHVRSIIGLVLFVFIADAGAELISAAILGGAAIISGILGYVGVGQAASGSAAAQREANTLNMALYEEEGEKEQKRWDAQTALAKINLKLQEEQTEWNEDQLLEKKSYDRAFDISNRLITLANSGQVRGQNLANMWASQSRLNA